MKKKILDIPKIRKTLRKKHKTLMDKIGDTANMLSADHELVISRITSKISVILDVFIHEKIIDTVEPVVDSYYTGFHILKNGFRKSVYIWTDGEDIFIRDSSFSIKYGSISPTLKTIKVADLDEEKFEDFANELCDYIHITIYNSLNALDAKFFKYMRE